MGLFDKIKDNAKTISMKAIEATREYDDEYEAASQQQAAGTTVEPMPANLPEETTEFIVEEEQTAAETPQQDQPAQEAEAGAEAEATQPAKDDADKTSEARKSKVTELTKEEHEKAEKEKRQAKAKQAAKERLAKSYTPSYKKTKAEEAAEKETVEVKTVKNEAPKPSDKKKSAQKPSQTFGIVDITPGKIVDPVKRAIYARERAALNALASQRKLNGTVPLYVANHMNFKTRVFINRIEYSGSFGKNVLPIEHVAWVKLRNAGTGVIVETDEGKRVVMVVKPSDRLAFADAVLKVQAMQPKKGKIKDTQTVRIDQLEQFGNSVDEIEKLAKLYDKGILSQEEFDAKKKQLLGL